MDDQEFDDHESKTHSIRWLLARMADNRASIQTGLRKGDDPQSCREFLDELSRELNRFRAGDDPAVLSAIFQIWLEDWDGWLRQMDEHLLGVGSEISEIDEERARWIAESATADCLIDQIKRQIDGPVAPTETDREKLTDEAQKLLQTAKSAYVQDIEEELVRLLAELHQR